MQPASEERDSKTDGQSALEESLLGLLRGIQKYVPAGDDELGRLTARFQQTGDPRELVKSALKILEAHQLRRNSDAAASELANAVKALPGLQGNVERWNRVEQQIKAISSRDDLEVTKARLCADVAMARAEALQERQKITTLFSGALAKLEVPAAPDGTAQAEESGTRLDQLTGLPTRPFAEAELTRLHGEESDCYATLFVVKRLALINAKFGYSRGDQVLMKVVMHLAQSLPDFRHFYRWAPCAFLTLAPPDFTYKELRSKIQMIELARLAPTLEWEGRSAMVPVAMDCRILSVKDFTAPADLFLRLDTLAADN
jgi:GGDEF domain-containing protein